MKKLIIKTVNGASVTMLLEDVDHIQSIKTVEVPSTSGNLDFRRYNYITYHINNCQTSKNIYYKTFLEKSLR